MSSVDYQNNLIDAIQTIVDNSIANAGFDKTIKATIVKCVDSATGKYTVKFQNTTFYAYSTSNDLSFTKDTMVYILIPNGDMSQTKTILGSVDKLGTEYIGTIEGDESYDYIGTNCVHNNSEFSLCTYKTETKILYDKTNNINLINFNENDAVQYLTSADNLICGAKIKTAINKEQRYKGNYGIKYILLFKDNNDVDIYRSYTIDVNNMTGMPYNLINTTRQFAAFAIDGANFQYVERIEIFVKDFPNSSETEANDIFISNIEFYGADRLDSAILANYSLGFNTPNGTYWNLADTEDKTIQAQIRIAGKLAELEDQNAEFYWFREDNRVDDTSANYNRKGGRGWACLNEKNIIDSTESGQAFEWVPAPYELTITKDNNTAKENKYKCVAVYDTNTIISNEIIIYNNTQDYSISIESTNGTRFFDNGTTNLICSISDATLAEDPNLTYNWSSTDNNNITEILDEKTSSVTIEVNTIVEFTTYKCSLFINDTYLGSASITLTNKVSESTTGYSVVINNGTMVYQYDENGIAPNNQSLDYPIDILPLSITVYDEYGTDITSNFNNENDTNVTWTVPITNTMIKVSNTPDNKDDEYAYYHGKTLNFNILPLYRPQYKNNDIKVSVKCGENSYASATTNLSFIRQGETGTSGTSVSARIVVDNNDDYIFTMINEDTTALSKTLKLELFENGESLTVTNPTWSILTNKATTNLTINNGVLTCSKFGDETTGATLQKVANIVKAEIEYDNVWYYATMPIVLIDKISADYDIEYVKTSGFRTVEYTSAGNKPQYDNSNPFKINVSKTSGALGEITYEWSVNGNLEMINSIIRPKKSYDGYDVTNTVYCVIKEDEVQIARVLISIDMYLNRYGLAKINQWDGNSIETDDGTILAPQVGAGSKDDSNRFSGILMGTIKENNTSIDGLVGYSQGKRTLLLNAADGSATFGSAGSGQIKFDGTNAIIDGGNYDEEAGTGMRIDLDKPSIKYGSGNFELDENGKMKCAGLIEDGGILSMLQFEGMPSLALTNCGLGSVWGVVGDAFGYSLVDTPIFYAIGEHRFLDFNIIIPSSFKITKVILNVDRMLMDYTYSGTHQVYGCTKNLGLYYINPNSLSGKFEYPASSDVPGGSFTTSSATKICSIADKVPASVGLIANDILDITNFVSSQLSSGRNILWMMPTTPIVSEGVETTSTYMAERTGIVRASITIYGIYTP